jgi:hypothetical protein
MSSYSYAAETGPAQAPDKAKAAASADWQFGLGLGFSLASKAKFDNGTVTTGGSSYTFTGDLDYKNAAVLEASGRYMPENSWGCILGLQIDGEREFDSGTITVAGLNVSLSSADSKLQVSNLFANAVYRWNQFYLPFGLNVSSAKFTAASGFSGTSDSSGALGAQVGVGYLPDEHWALELMSRAIGFKLKTATSTATADYGTGYLSTLIFAGKYYF